MTDLAVETAALTPRRKANGAAGPVKIKGEEKPQAVPGSAWSLEDTRRPQRSFDFERDGKKLKVVYQPDAFSNRELRELQRPREDDEEGHSYMLTALSRLIVDWDLYVSFDPPVKCPTTPEALDGLPPDFLLALLNGIGDDLNPPEKATGSGSFS
jgi:hypothetical protein